MAKDVETLEGWFVLHDFRVVDWTAWKETPAEERQAALDEFFGLLQEWNQVEEKKEGSHGLYSIVGQKADFSFTLLRPTLQKLNELEFQLSKTRLADYLIPSYSYVSVVELSTYVHSPDPDNDPQIQARLKPILPKTEHICFYPMNKRREGNDNWYMLSMDERASMMRSHGMIGRSYAGRVIQMISGSVGMDDWEWGVTLFSDDPVAFKKLVYEMRFDEVSARYGEFGSFLIGNRLTEEKIKNILAV